MIEKTIYYALLLEGDSRSHPSGLARRQTDTGGGFRDEAFKKGGSWSYTPVIASAERGDMTFDLVQISEEEADRIVQRFRDKWAREASSPD